MPIPNYHYQITTVEFIDGDTTRFGLDLGFNIIITQSCRYFGLDTPEHTTLAGQLVSQVTEKWLRANAPLSVTSVARDKFADRFDGVVYAVDGVYTINNYLLVNQLAKPYTGGKKPPWLDSELTEIVKRCYLILGTNRLPL